MTSIFRAPLALALLFAGCQAVAWASPFDKAPAPLKAYLEKARIADQIADPMQRCLAYPDYPGNHWPAGAAAAQCKVTHSDGIAYGTIKRLVDLGNAAELDALFRRDLDRHFSKTDFSEVIHADLRESTVIAGQNELTQKWIELAPESPFANLARGRYLYDEGYRARGYDYAGQTPVEKMNRMSDFMGMAVKFYEKAIRLEPRLLPAYSGLMQVARVDSRTALGESAFARARAIDPGCRDVARSRMIQLQPRWGGSYEEMEAYAAELAKLVPKRPLMAGVIAEVALDRAEVLSADGNAPRAAEVLRAAVDKTPARIPMLRMAEMMIASRMETWETLARLTAAYRFQERDKTEAGNRIRLLLALSGDKEWAFRQLKRSVQSWPEEDLLLLLRQTATTADDLDAVEGALARKAGDRETGNGARFQLLQLALARKQAAKADQYAAAVLGAFPPLSQKLFAKAYIAMRRGDERGATDAFHNFLAFVKERKSDMPEEIALAERYVAGERDPALTGNPGGAAKP